MSFSRVLIVDGYTDEPAGFGVPPYIDVLPRYLAGAVWSVDPSAMVRYRTVDEIRTDIHGFLREAEQYDLVIVVAGAIVPGRYLGGEPIKLQEVKEWFSMIEKPFKVLVGAAAKWGFGNEGGKVAALPREVERIFDAIVRGDPEAYIYDLVKYGPEKADPQAKIESMDFVDVFAIKGAKIVKQHPNHGYNLIAEIETFRGCPRWLRGGCSFCVTKLYGPPRQRSVQGVVKEVEALYSHGVRHFRIGRQSDILVYGSRKLMEEEWPPPSPETLEKLFHGIRQVAPSLKTLHIDNVNPGTIVKHEELAREALKVIVKYHTPGDVAALGIETADEKVMKLNNLKVTADEALKAIELINEIGGRKGYNGLPELLPGVNFVLGLIGETKETYELNKQFLEKVYRRGLLVRRINVRQVLVLPGTRMWQVGDEVIKKHKHLAKSFSKYALRMSELFLKRLIPTGSVLRELYVERYDEKLRVTYARQAGSYPIVVELPCRIEPPAAIDVVVYGHAGRSLRGLPVPLNPNSVSLTLLKKALGARVAEAVAKLRPVVSDDQIERALGESSKYFSVKGWACTQA